MIIKCPYCKYNLEIDVKFAEENGRVFCGTCCKAFDIELREEETTEDPYSDMENYFADFPLD